MTARPFPLTKKRYFPHQHLRAADFEWERTYWGKTAAMNGRMLGSGRYWLGVEQPSQPALYRMLEAIPVKLLFVPAACSSTAVWPTQPFRLPPHP